MSLIDTDHDVIESILFLCRNVKVYKIPARPTLAGWKAQEWGDSSFMWEGRLRIVEQGDKCSLKLEDATTGELFANCPYDRKGTAVEPVLDSSRYFVLRIVDEQGRKASVGMGFEERGDAFDFNVALQDHTKRLNNPNASANAAASSDPSKPAEPKKDYSLKPGQSFTISVPGSSGRPKEKKAEPVGGLSAGGGLGGFMLPPPPSGRKR